MNSMAQEHWDGIYQSKTEDALSWHQAAPTVSLDLIREFASPGSSVLDIGCGSSTLTGTLTELGYSNCCALDISLSALKKARERLNPATAAKIDWKVVSILDQPQLPFFDLWHDRAVFHFLTDPEQRAAYVALATQTVRSQRHLVLGTFALNGPERCSGLPVQRYDAASLSALFEESFILRKEVQEVHQTPWGASQPFQYVVMQRR
jgi:2-polyprenyl-3-methyl-5-hydroxy-6-metoxy-1,4-benzoquinol methylase